MILLSVAVLSVVARIVRHDKPPPALPTLSMGQRPSVAPTVTRRILRPETRHVGRPVARDPGSMTPNLVHSAWPDASDVSDASIIGEPRPVDESAWWDTSTEAIEFGDPMDADDPTTSRTAFREIIELGEPLDADDPTAWTGQRSPTLPREIGRPLDADLPWHRSPEGRRRSVDIGPALDAVPFELFNPVQNDRNHVRSE